MLRHALRALSLSCVGLALLAGQAAAQRATIVYAGEQPNSLAGGGERSYGYGSASGENEAPVIDIRRNVSGRVVQTAAEGPAPEAETAAAEQGAQPWLERERVGPPYEANGRWYVPTPEPGYEQTGVASWYGADFHGRPTASGEAFDQEALTAAHPTLPIPSLVQITNLENGREVIVRVNDRGPFVGGRLIDLSRRAAEVLGFEQSGHARVHVRYLGPAPRRVGAPESAAPPPEAAPSPAPSGPVENPAAAEEGPLSLLPASSGSMELAGGPEDEAAPRPSFTPASYVAPPQAPGDYYVQIGAFSEPGNAQRVRAAAASVGPVLVDVRLTASGAELFRVRVGPWRSAEEAEAARRRLLALGYAESMVAAR